MMDPEWKAEWIAALRSGEFKQGEGCLRVGPAFCCLGVLCQLVPSVRWEPFGFAAHNGRSAHETFLPTTLGKELNVSRGQQRRLADMNDDGKSFDQIADYIEANL